MIVRRTAPAVLAALLLALAAPAATASPETAGNADAFVAALNAGDYARALEEADRLAPEAPEYSLFGGVLASILGDQQGHRMRTFDYVRNPGRDAGPAELVRPFASRLDTAPGQAFLGVFCWERDDKEAARPYLERALALDPADPFALNYHGMYAYYAEDWQAYLDASLAALAAKPDYSEAYNNASVAEMGLGDREKALSFLAECLVHCPDPHPNTWINLLKQVGESGIGMKASRGEYTMGETIALDDAGIDTLYRLVSPDAHHATMLLNEMCRQDLYGPVARILDLAERDGLGIAVPYYRAQIAFYNARDDECLRQIRLFLEGTGQDYRLLYNAGNDMLQFGNAEEAGLLYGRALESLPPADRDFGMRIHCNYGNALLQLGRYDEAIVQLEAALEDNPWDAITLTNLGRLCLETDRPQEALAYLERALDVPLEFGHRKYIERMIAGIE